MSGRPVSHSVRNLTRQFKSLNTSDPLTQCLIPRLNRSFATAVDAPVAERVPETVVVTASPAISPSTTDSVLTTLYSWPDLEPQRYKWYPSQHLGLPLRKDILHRAVVYEADVTRGVSTASTKYRRDVHGSNRKIAPQKGMGRARVGDKKSPIRRGGGVAFGPHPRDFSSELPRKIYDLAWRTALSYRYSKGELTILSDVMSMPRDATPRLLENIFLANKWDRSHGRSLLVADRMNNIKVDSHEEESLAEAQHRLFQSMAQLGIHGSIKDLDDVDVKDLLETGRVIIDTKSLKKLLWSHSADLRHNIKQVF